LYEKKGEDMGNKKELLILSIIGIFLGSVPALLFPLEGFASAPILLLRQGMFFISRFVVYLFVTFIVAWVYRETCKKSFLYAIFVLSVAFATFYLLVLIPFFSPRSLGSHSGTFPGYTNILNPLSKDAVILNLLLVVSCAVFATVSHGVYRIKLKVWRYVIISSLYLGFLYLFCSNRWYPIIQIHIRAVQYEYVYIPMERTFEAIFQFAIVTVVFWAILKTEQTKTPLKL